MTTRKIAIVSQKGGVGKTATTLSLGAGLSRKGKKVLLVDLDPQGNIATSVLDENNKGIFDYLIYGTPLESCITHMGANLDLLTSQKNLQKAENVLIKKEKTPHFLKEKLSKIKGYDFIILDLAPSFSEINKQALLFADEAIIPVSTDFLGYDALTKTIETIKELNDEFDHELKIIKIVPTMFDKRAKLSKEILSLIESNYYTITSNPIRVDSKLKEAPKAKKSIFSYAPSSKGALDYSELVNQVLQNNYQKEEAKNISESKEILEAI